MLMRTDPFCELDRMTQQMLGPPGATTRPTAMRMDAWRQGEEFIVEFDLPQWGRRMRASGGSDE